MDVHLRIDSKFVDVPRVFSAIRPLLEGNAPPDAINLAEIGLHEVINNIIEHGYGGKPGHSIDIRSCRRRTMVAVAIEDMGAIHPAALRRKDPPPETFAGLESMSERGRGLWLIEQCFSRVRYSVRDGRNLTRLYIRSGGAAASREARA